MFDAFFNWMRQKAREAFREGAKDALADLRDELPGQGACPAIENRMAAPLPDPVNGEAEPTATGKRGRK